MKLDHLVEFLEKNNLIVYKNGSPTLTEGFFELFHKKHKRTVREMMDAFAQEGEVFREYILFEVLYESLNKGFFRYFMRSEGREEEIDNYLKELCIIHQIDIYNLSKLISFSILSDSSDSPRTLVDDLEKRRLDNLVNEFKEHSKGKEPTDATINYVLRLLVIRNFKANG